MECKTIERYTETNEPVYKKKKSFDTLELDISHAKWVNSKDHVINKVVAYKCSKCFKFHVGRNGKPLTDKDREKFKKTL